MEFYSLPTTAEIGGAVYGIRTDYRVILDICAAVSDPELDEKEKSLVALTAFYPALNDMPQEHYKEALEACMRFIDMGGEDDRKKSPRLVDWEQDFQYIIAPINQAMGRELRAVEYMHWWTFMAAYQSIGDCTFAQIVRIRDKLARGKSLDKQDREWYRRNRQLVDFKKKYTEAEQDLFNAWGGA